MIVGVTNGNGIVACPTTVDTCKNIMTILTYSDALLEPEDFADQGPVERCMAIKVVH